MYPAGELKLLEARKALVRVRIAEKRWQCVEAGVELARPIAAVDRALEIWRGIPPLAKVVGVPAAFFLLRKLFGHSERFASLLRLAPTVLRTARMAMGKSG